MLKLLPMLRQHSRGPGTDSKSVNASNRNIQIDCLRAIASLLVIGAHFHSVLPPGPLAYFAETWKRLGAVGVDLFFVLSGFLIGTLLITEMQKYGNLNVPRFLLRRGFKLYPVYYFFMCYCIVVPAIKSAVILKKNGWATLATELNEHWTSLVFIQNYGLARNPEGHTWSLAVEEHFYLVLPIVIAFLGPKRIWKWLIPICLSFIPVCLGLRALNVIQSGPNDLLFKETHLRVDALLFGVALAVTALKFPEIFAKFGRSPRMLITGGVFLWLAVFLPSWPDAFQDTLGFTLRLLGSAAILVGACNVKAPAGRIQMFLAWIGVNSYAIYVWHTTAIGITEKSVGKILSNHFQNKNVQWMLLSPIIILSCVAVGTLVTRVVETPALNLRNKLFPSRGRALALPSDTPVTERNLVNVQNQSIKIAVGK